MAMHVFVCVSAPRLLHEMKHEYNAFQFLHVTLAINLVDRDLSYDRAHHEFSKKTNVFVIHFTANAI